MELFPKNQQRNNVAVVADTSGLLQSKDSPISRIKLLWSQIRANLQVLLSPGDKQFKDLPKRVRLMLVSFGIPLLYAAIKLTFLAQSTSMAVWGGVGLALAVVTFAGMYWGVKGQVRKDSYFSVLPLPSLFVFSNVLFLSTIFVGEVNRLYLWGLFTVAVTAFMIFLYIVALAVNVLNVTLFYTIPLSRLGETVSYVSSILILFLLGYATSSMIIPMIILGSWIKVAITIFSFACVVTTLTSAMWRYFLPYSKDFGLFTVAISALLIISFAVLSLSLPYSWLVGMMFGIVGYIIYGYVIHKEQNTFKSTVIVEFLGVIIIAFLIGILA